MTDTHTTTGTDAVPSLRIRGLSKTFGETEVLTSIDLDVKKGEFLTLLGPSGSGKTTLLRIIAGFETATGGELLLDGTDISVLKPSERKLGMVFQNYALFPHLTVAENIAYGLKVRKYDRAALRRRVDHMLEVVGLGRLAARKPTQLSGGQQQRVALARALAYEPEILLMDEPLGALDRSLRLQMEQEIKQVHKETGTTVIYVTHDQEEALVLSDRVAIMNQGVFAGLDTPMNLFTRPENSFVARFFSDSNVLDATLTDGLLQIAGQEIPVKSPLHGEVKVAVRPARAVLSAAADPLTGEGPALRIPAVIHEVHLLGETEQIGLRREDGTPFTVRRPVGSGGPVHEGEQATIIVPPAGMTVMAD